MTPYAERLIRVEVEVRELKDELLEHKATTADEFKEINRKLDDLLVLRNKGAGILWFISGMIAVASAIFGFIHWR